MNIKQLFEDLGIPGLKENGRMKYTSGVHVDEAYELVPAARENGMTVKMLGLSRTNDSTIVIRIFGSGESVFVKVYAANATQAEAVLDELSDIADPGRKFQMELCL